MVIINSIFGDFCMEVEESAIISMEFIYNFQTQIQIKEFLCFVIVIINQYTQAIIYSKFNPIIRTICIIFVINQHQYQMQMMTNMNAKLNLGWKMTNMSCVTCGGVTLAEPSPSIQQLYCPKCDKTFAQSMTQITAQQDEDQDYFNQVLKETNVFNVKQNTQNKPLSRQAESTFQKMDYQILQKRSERSDQVSKKIGQKLISGWTMLEQACEDCNVPLMKSKKGQKLCMSCDKDYAIIQKQLKQKQNEKANAQKYMVKSQKPQQVKHAPSVQKKNQNKIKSGQTNSQCLSRIQAKSLAFLQQEIDNAIRINSVSALSSLLQLVSKVKDLV